MIEPYRLRVGCKGGSRYFEGVCGFLGVPQIQIIDRQESTRMQNYLEILKIQKMIVQKY